MHQSERVEIRHMDKEQQASFRPAALMGGGHVQTIAGVLFSRRRDENTEESRTSVMHTVHLSDGDAIVLHEDANHVTLGDANCILLIHGLGGCALSAYMLRISQKLLRLGYRVFRMDQRNSGEAFGLSSKPYHAGRSEDVEAALLKMQHLYPSTRRAVAGFSLAGNMTLKFLGEQGTEASRLVDCAIAVNPPVELEECVQTLRKGVGRLYDRYFLRILKTQVLKSDRLAPAARERFSVREPRGIFEFDEIFTAPVSGFQSALDYYEKCSGARFVATVRTPLLLMAADNDPLIPINSFPDVNGHDKITFLRSRSGGHLGYFGRRVGGDRRWMDARVIEWIERHLPN